MRADASEKLPSLIVTPVHSRLRTQEQADQTDDRRLVDLQRALDGAAGPVVGRYPLVSGALKVERRRLVAGFDQASADRTGRTTSAHEPIIVCPLLLLLCASCAARVLIDRV